jgi:hypothetical protein
VAALLAGCQTEPEKKQLLGERLLTGVEKILSNQDASCKVVGMLLELDNQILLRLLDSEVALHERVQNAMQVLASKSPQPQPNPPPINTVYPLQAGNSVHAALGKNYMPAPAPDPAATPPHLTLGRLEQTDGYLEVVLKSVPNSSGTIVAKIANGMAVTVLQCSGEYAQVKTHNGYEGWCRYSNIKV